ncbi:MAG: hypothetical protein FJ004_04655 [Chloroflexi bacterium]|nr:hypothetical protein [Chloroflexota bacterium]
MLKISHSLINEATKIGNNHAPDLLIIACSATKKQTSAPLTALELYDGPAYRVLRKGLNGSGVRPEIWILSAKHGLIESRFPLLPYDVKMDQENIQELSPEIELFVKRFAPPGKFRKILIWAGKQYLFALPPTFLTRAEVDIAQGSIGRKLSVLKGWCADWAKAKAEPSNQGLARGIHSRANRTANQPLKYFIPDWDDYLDPDYDFINDRFSWDGGERIRLYAHELFKRRQLYDGILVSLGQAHMAKGFARNGLKPEAEIIPARQYLHLTKRQMVLGDCGAFSYRQDPVPPFTVAQVVKSYSSLGVDIGASIDHIPFGDVKDNDKIRPLRSNEISERIELTARLASDFLVESRKTGKFIPMGVIQAKSSDEFASLAESYIKVGYQYIALGGLVPRGDDEIQAIAEAVVLRIERVYPQSAPSIRIHLFGVLREKLFPRLKELGIASFDSGSYLRKAWLRSDKNYLSTTGKWYSALRVPYRDDPRFCKNALEAGVSVKKLEKLETTCLRLLREFDRKQRNLKDVLDALEAYDGLLLRTSDVQDLRDKYERTLEDKPWKSCKCPVCRNLGIEVIIFRGFNRNKRRGFHNTWVFFNELCQLRGGGPPI